MLLNFEDDTPFATGVATYDAEPIPGGDDTQRIRVYIEVDEELEQAILDTGGQYFWCTQEMVGRVAFSETIGDKKINLKGQDVRGTLARISIVLLADEGESLRLEVTAFLPDLNQEFGPAFLPFPYLGFHNCMDRARFAIDPSQDQNKIYFGAQP
ncbi:MAG TPA: hypothetical protein VFX97_04150 [Pyrinomonadaceae bacterium]|nr:hypothetical protein [Pyrinomonadaceae bacterium]